MKDSEKITVKPGLEKEYEQYVAKNQDSYSNAVILVTAKVCKFLDEGKTPEESEGLGIKDSGITGFMAGCMAQAIKYFHPRGDEFNRYWNKQFGVTEDTKGTVNPAILTIGKK